MDAVCVKGDWDVVIARRDDGVVEGVLVYHKRRYRGFELLIMPPMTAYNGIYIFYPNNQKAVKKERYTYRVTEKLMSGLPSHSLYFQQYHPDFHNWLGLYWNGYKQMTRYTYRIDKSQSEEEMYAKIKYTTRKDIESAKAIVSIEEIDFETYREAAVASFSRRGRSVPGNLQVLRNLHDTFSPERKVKILGARHNESGALSSGVILAMDLMATYWISGFVDIQENHKTTQSLLLWHAITNGTGITFDFEGSIIKEIESYTRSFGGELTPHSRIYNVPNFFLRKGLALFKPDFFV